jgi:WD40 repeat protein
VEYYRLCSSDKIIRIWGTAPGLVTRVLAGSTGAVRCIAFRADGNCLASGCADGTITIWDMPTDKAIRILAGGHKGSVNSVAFANLRLTGGNLTKAIDKLKSDVGWEVQSAFNQQQHPQLGGNWQGKDLILSGAATQPRDVLNPDLLRLINLQSHSVAKP